MIHLNKHTFTLFILAVLMSALLVLSSCESSPFGPVEEDRPIEQADHTYITGTITQASTNAPVPQAIIVVAGDNYATDSFGKYAIIKQYTPGEYTLRVQKSGYVSINRKIQVSGDASITQVRNYSIAQTEAPTQVESSSGGTVTSTTNPNFSVQIPPNALSQTTNISVTPVTGSSIPQQPQQASTSFSSVNLQPEGTQFNEPVTITIPIGVPLELLRAGINLKGTLVGSDGSEEDLGNVVLVNDSTAVQVQVTHFSTAIIGTDQFNIQESAFTGDRVCTGIFAECDDEDPVSESVILSYANNSNFSDELWESWTGFSLEQSPTTVRIQRTSTQDSRYELCYRISGTTYSFTDNSGTTHSISVDESANAVKRAAGSCHDQGGG